MSRETDWKTNKQKLTHIKQIEKILQVEFWIFKNTWSSISHWGKIIQVEFIEQLFVQICLGSKLVNYKFNFLLKNNESKWGGGYFLLLFTFIVVKLATVVESDQKAPFSIATTPGCRGGRYSFLLIYPWYVPYIAEC